MSAFDDAGSRVGGVLDVLSRREDAELDEVVALVAQVCDSPAAAITIRHGDRFHVPVAHGFRPVVRPAQGTFCQHAMSTDDVFCIEDARTDHRFSGVASLTGEQAGIRFYASAPVHSPEGAMIGRLCVFDPVPRPLTGLQRRSLQALARDVSMYIALQLMRAGQVSAASRLDSEEALESRMSEFAAELSHDLRVPLSAIAASHEMLQDELRDYADPFVTTLLQRAVRATERMSRMVEQKMEVHQVAQPPVRQRVDLGVVVAQLLADSAALLESAGATVEAEELPTVEADPDGMYSVLQNLISNSVKFARPGSPARVLVRARPLGDAWRISVCDDGVGLPDTAEVDLFSMFSRGTSDVDGHGIGLGTVARIIAAHGGRVGVTTPEAGGAEVWFELPADRVCP